MENQTKNRRVKILLFISIGVVAYIGLAYYIRDFLKERSYQTDQLDHRSSISDQPELKHSISGYRRLYHTVRLGDDIFMKGCAENAIVIYKRTGKLLKRMQSEVPGRAEAYKNAELVVRNRELLARISLGIESIFQISNSNDSLNNELCFENDP